MTDQTRNLLISLSSHMAYMQGQLEAFTDQSDPEDYYWYRESVRLRQKVTDALAEGDGPAVPDGREPASVTGEPSDEELLELMPQQMRDDLAAAARALAGFDPDNIKAASVFRIILNRHSVDHARAVLSRWGTPNLTETRRSLKDAWAAHQPAIEAAAKAGMEACRMDEPAVPDGREPTSVIDQLTSPPDWRGLCEKLLLFGEQAGEICTNEGLWPECDLNYTLLNRARAALAEPEPEGPTLDDILEQPQAAPMAGWQPIDTAPKDGTEILASDYDAIEIVSWAEDQEWKTWYWTGRDGQVMHPAWWQPLLDHPPIPTTEAQP